MTPRDRAVRICEAEARAAWNRSIPEPFAEDGITVERAIDEAGVEVFATFRSEAPVLWLARRGDDLVLIGADDDGPVYVVVDT